METGQKHGVFSALSDGEKAKVATVYGIIIGATVLGFVASFVVGQEFPLLAGLALTAYALGLRHGVDADHIAAIDNTTRKLLQDRKRPLTVGTWFSLGHSTVVFGMIVVAILTTQALTSGNPGIIAAGSIIGPTVSGVFLVLIGLINVLIAMSVYRVFVEVRNGGGKVTAAEVDQMLNKRGFLNRVFQSLFRLIREPWQIYPVGVLFGLGFDTATEVLLIAISVGIAIGHGIAIWTVLLLPFMFMCGMVVVDTTDGVTMRMAYGWAFLHPLRKLYYNLTVTMISVVVAIGIGGIEVLQVLGARLDLGGPFWGLLGSLDFETLGFGIIGVFVVAWAVSIAYWKLRGYEERVAEA